MTAARGHPTGPPEIQQEEAVHRDLDVMRDILAPLDDVGREGMLATLIFWCALTQEDPVQAINRIFDEVIELAAACRLLKKTVQQ